LSLIIGYTRQRDDKSKNTDKFNLDSFDFNKNYQNYTGIIRNDKDKEREKELAFPNDLNDPLLDKFDKL
jgi:hypothetical protein